MKNQAIKRRDIVSGIIGVGIGLPLTGCVYPSKTKAAMTQRHFTAYPVGTALDFLQIHVPNAVNLIETNGYAAIDDDGGWLFKRVSGRPRHKFAIRDANGEWFEGLVIDGAIMPGPFGALAQTQNEGPALQEAMQTAIAMGCWLKLDSMKTYVVNPSKQGKNGWHATALSGQSIKLDFNGATLKMAAELPTRSNSFFHAFSIQMRKTHGVRQQKIPLVHIRNARIDGNLRRQLLPDTPYAYEQRALLRISAANGNRIDRVIIEDAVIVDRIADGILVGPSTSEAFDDDRDGRKESAAIKRCDIIRPYCEKAIGSKRAFICVGSGCSVYNILQPRCAIRSKNGDFNAIETEFSRIGNQDVTVNIEDGEVDALEFGMPRNSPDHSRVNINASNLKVRDYYVQLGGSIRTTNCILPITAGIGHAIQNGIHRKTTFRHGLKKNGDVQSILLRADYTPSMMGIETDCRHELITAPTHPKPTSAAIKMGVTVKSKTNEYVAHFENTKFVGRFPYSIDNIGGGRVVTKNCTIAGTKAGIRTGSFGKYIGTYESSRDNWQNVESGITVDISETKTGFRRHVISSGNAGGGRIRLRGKFARKSVKISDQPLD